METVTVTSEILNDLIEINNDRIEGYEEAMKELTSGNDDLKSLFAEMIDQSRKARMALGEEVEAGGSDMEKGTTITGKIYRAWLDVKAAFTGRDRFSILSACEHAEDAAQDAYQSALDSEDLAAYLKEMILEQKYILKRSHDKIRALRDNKQ